MTRTQRKITKQYFPKYSQVYKEYGRKIKAGIRSIQLTAEKSHNTIYSKKVLFTAIYNLKDEQMRKLYSEQTGELSATSFRGNQYITVAYTRTRISRDTA